MYHFFIRPEEIADGKITISGSDVNHIKNVLRMKSGEELMLSDGMGTDYHCAIKELSEEAIICRILEEKGALSEPTVQFYLFQGLPKGDKLDQVVQKSVELGVYQIIPMEMTHCVVRYDEKKQKVSIGVRLAREYWYKGIANHVEILLMNYLKEAGIRTITGHVMRHNTASARTVQKLGFVNKYPGLWEDWGREGPVLTDKYIYKF